MGYAWGTLRMTKLLENTNTLNSPFTRDMSLPREANIIIAGGGGFFLEVESFLRDMARAATAQGEKYNWTIGGVLDHSPHRNEDAVSNWPALGTEDTYEFKPNDYVVIAIGEPKIRRKIGMKLIERGAKFFNIIHPTAFLAETAKIGQGVIIGPSCYVASKTVLHDQVVMHATSQVGHDSNLEAYSVLCPYSALSGFCNVGEACFLGTGAAMAPQTSIGAHSKVAAGSFQIQKSIEAGSLVFGNPSEHRRAFKIPK